MKSWQRPTAEQISRVDLLALRPQEERYFFSRLENPLWIDALADQGTLEPPEPTVDDDGAVSHRQWPFSAYLARVAGVHPDHARVAAIIEELADTENAFVQGDLIRAMTALDPCYIADLLPRVESWVTARPAMFLTLDLVGELCVQALACGENESAVKALLLALFEPRDVSRDSMYPDPSIRWWEATEFASRILPNLIERNWELTVTALLDSLRKQIAVQGGSDASPTSGYDFTAWWLPESSEEDDSRETGESLAYLVGQSLDAIALLPAVPLEAVSDLLVQDNWAVFRRLRLRNMSCRAAAGVLEPPMLTALGDPAQASEYPPCPEFDSLLQAAFERGSQDTKDAILKALASAAAGGGEQSDYWLFGRLAVISDDLPADERSLFRDFIERFGPPPQRDSRPSVKLESPEKQSPLDPGQAGSMSAAQLAAYAREWTQPENDFFFEQPTWKGLAAEVEREAKARPLEFSQAANSFAGLERTIVNALFRGLKEAVRDGGSLDWGSTLQLMRHIAPENEAIEDAHENRFGRDVSWSEAKHAALDLLRTALGREHLLPSHYATPTWKTIEMLAVNGEAVFDDPLDDARDSVFAALNSTRSQAAYAAVAYLPWLRSDEADEIPNDVRAFFMRILDPHLEPFIGMRAAVAHKLPQLAYVNEEWLIELLPDIFPDPSANPEHWSAAWDAYLRHSAPMLSRAMLREMIPLYKVAIERVDEGHRISGRDDRVVLLGIQLAAMFLRRDIELDDANLDAFFRRSSAPVRTRVYGWIGRVAAQEDLPDYWYDRARHFVEWRELRVREDALDPGELRMLGWLVASGRFAVDWWAPRLPSALRSSGDNIGGYIPLEPMMREVAEASEHHSRMAVEVLEIVLRQDEARLHLRYLESADRILADAIANPDTTHRGRRAADSLARAGHERFEKFANQTP